MGPRLDHKLVHLNCLQEFLIQKYTKQFHHHNHIEHLHLGKNIPQASNGIFYLDIQVSGKL